MTSFYEFFSGKVYNLMGNIKVFTKAEASHKKEERESGAMLHLPEIAACFFPYFDGQPAMHTTLWKCHPDH